MNDDDIIERIRIETALAKENAARAVGDDKRRLERELRSAVSCLINELRPLFRKARFDFATKRIVSVCGKHALQWQMRQRPDMPESYHNQQTNRGTVKYVALA